MPTDYCIFKVLRHSAQSCGVLSLTAWPQCRRTASTDCPCTYCSDQSFCEKYRKPSPILCHSIVQRILSTFCRNFGEFVCLCF